MTNKKTKVRDEGEIQRDEIRERIKRKDYLVTVYQTGDKMMSLGNPDRQAETRRYFDVCSLEDIPKHISFMKSPFWNHKDLENPDVNPDEIPYEEKKWGLNYHIAIEPLSEEMEKDYVKASEDGFFKDWRLMREDLEGES